MRAERPFFATPFTREQGLRHGLTDWTIRTGYVRVLHGVYVSQGVRLTLVLRATAALLVAPRGAVLARHSAAALWDAVVPETSDIHLVVAPGRRVRREGLDVHEASGVESARRGGLTVTTPIQTFLDLGVDSPMETRLRMLLVLAGLPEPVVNHPVRDELTGRVRYRLDLAYPDLRLAVEYDGRQHAENTAQWRWDVTRREELENDGWRLLVVLPPDIYRTPEHGRAGQERGRGQGGRIGRVSDEWRRFFPGRD